jgi:NAD(P)-dependent dehydrogenase (short-subunit alcohol dehydrogenase family)
LSGDDISPERKLADLNSENLQEVLTVNSVLPAMVLKAFWPLIRASNIPRIAVLSARVGSIEDNRLGGWYAYRASKAALNMLVRTASIELKRLNRRAKLIAYHPGTVDTPLSKPFQRSIPSDQLLTPEFAARRLHEVLLEADDAGELSYLDWRGETIPW